jgi:hypothetical protein
MKYSDKTGRKVARAADAYMKAFLRTVEIGFRDRDPAAYDDARHAEEHAKCLLIYEVTGMWEEQRKAKARALNPRAAKGKK